MRKYLLTLAMAFVSNAYSKTLESEVSAMLNEAIAESHAINGSVAIMEVNTEKLLVSIGNIDKVQSTKIYTPFVLFRNRQTILHDQTPVMQYSRTNNGIK